MCLLRVYVCVLVLCVCLRVCLFGLLDSNCNMLHSFVVNIKNTLSCHTHVRIHTSTHMHTNFLDKAISRNQVIPAKSWCIPDLKTVYTVQS